MCIRYGCLPAGIDSRIAELQQQLLRDDCYLPGFANQDPLDLARQAEVSAGSSLPGREAANVVSGISRDTDQRSHCWESDGIAPEGELLTLALGREAPVGQVRLTFDSNLNRAVKITLSAKRIAQQQVGPPAELVRDYEVVLVEGNYQRLNVLSFPGRPLCDSIAIRVKATNGFPNARIFEVRAYEQEACSCQYSTD